MPSNESRIEAAQAAMDAHARAKGDSGDFAGSQDQEECLVDILADLMHLAELEDIDFSVALSMAHHHYEEERRR